LKFTSLSQTAVLSLSDGDMLFSKSYRLDGIASSHHASPDASLISGKLLIGTAKEQLHHELRKNAPLLQRNHSDLPRLVLCG
jgi:hypothetical protein